MYKAEHPIKNSNAISRHGEMLIPENDFFHIESAKHQTSMVAGMTIQPKLSIGAPNDLYEKEPDMVAEKVMRMPENNFVQHKYNTCSGHIQRQSENEKVEDEKKAKLQQKPTEPDFLSLRTPFFERNVPHLWDRESALGVWNYNFRYFKNFGVSDNLASKAANLTAQFVIHAQLKADNPTWWEITDKDLKTTSLVGSVPLFSFDANLSNWKFLPFLQKESWDAIPSTSNKVSGENFLQRKCAQGKEMPLSDSITPFISMYIQ